MTALIRPLMPDDRSAWEWLWAGYQDFYGIVIPRETTELTWNRFGDEREPMHVLGAFDPESRLVGIVHVVFHRSTALPDWSCYLQDLFVDQSCRGRGYGAALIEAVADLARTNRAGRLYWMTDEHNLTARRLYDQVAARSGFIQYRKSL